jgi:hypothetical protein
MFSFYQDRFFFSYLPHSGPKNKRRKKADRRRGSRDRRGDYYDESSSPSGPTHRDARYNDMAPKYVLLSGNRGRSNGGVIEGLIFAKNAVWYYK